MLGLETTALEYKASVALFWTLIFAVSIKPLLCSKSWSADILLQLPLCMKKKESFLLWPQLHLGLQVDSHLDPVVSQDPIHTMSKTSLYEWSSLAQAYCRLEEVFGHSTLSGLFFIYAKAPSRFHLGKPHLKLPLPSQLLLWTRWLLRVSELGPRATLVLLISRFSEFFHRLRARRRLQDPDLTGKLRWKEKWYMCVH